MSDVTRFIPAEFHGVSLDIIDHAGKRWLTAKQIGLALGYNEANASTGITNLYNRHADEFSEADTLTIKLMENPKGGNPNTRVFSDTGCILLGMFASTPRAKEFRLWAKQVLAGQPALPAIPAARPGRVPLITRAIERQVFELFAGGNGQADIRKALGISGATVSQLLYAKYQFSPQAGEAECSPELIAAVAERHRQIEEARFIAEQQRIANRYLSQANNQGLSDALNQVGRNRLTAVTARQGGAQ